ncbi:cytochrome c [Rhodovulum sp. PH10]|uniref:cytochrome c n=1 Tax=Rhodovulum sp. PH10 TaxID=1187851 RepID=UPI00192AE0D7|nr:cytochrome c [Rhodovulum sp. PH10]
MTESFSSVRAGARPLPFRRPGRAVPVFCRVLPLVAMLAGGTSLAAAAEADAEHGALLARRWCAPCHVVAADQVQPTSEAAPFASIASRKGFDAGDLALFLLDPHPKMPSMNLTRAEAADLAAYVKTLAP